MHLPGDVTETHPNVVWSVLSPPPLILHGKYDDLLDTYEAVFVKIRLFGNFKGFGHALCCRSFHFDPMMLKMGALESWRRVDEV